MILKYSATVLYDNLHTQVYRYVLAKFQIHLKKVDVVMQLYLALSPLYGY